MKNYPIVITPESKKIRSTSPVERVLNVLRLFRENSLTSAFSRKTLIWQVE